MTITHKIVSLLETNAYTVGQLYEALNQEHTKPSIHCVMNTLKRRNAVLIVGRKTELSSDGRKFPSCIYKLKKLDKPLTIRNPKQSRYKADLSRAIKNHDRYRMALMRHNPQFMMYAKELKLDKGLL